VIKSPRVADGLMGVLSEYGNPEGIHVLLLRMNKGSKIRNIYTIHPKDSKSKNREIPQMTSHMRVAQFVSESLLSVYTDAEEIDNMQNPNKYSDFVINFSDIMARGGLSRSEDKSFFCGHMHPEGISLGVHALAKCAEWPSLYTSSSILRCDTSRYTVLPDGADISVIDGIDDRIRVVIPSGKKLVQSIAVKNYLHFMQGVRAMGGAVINTVFSSAMDKIQKLRCLDIEVTAVATTSDDSARAVLCKRNSTFDPSDVHSDYINLPIGLVKHVMMKDSDDKPILSPKLAEFNNVAATPRGMVTQTFVHGHLAIQPLNGDTIFADMLSCIGNAKMSISWGDSMDLVRSIYDSYIVMLQQRWLIKEEEMDHLFNLGILQRATKIFLWEIFAILLRLS